MEESKLKSKCYFCEQEFSHKVVIFGFDPALTQTCFAQNDTFTVRAPKRSRSPKQSKSDATMTSEDVIVPSEAEQTTDDSANPISASEKSDDKPKGKEYLFDPVPKHFIKKPKIEKVEFPY